MKRKSLKYRVYTIPTAGDKFDQVGSTCAVERVSPLSKKSPHCLGRGMVQRNNGSESNGPEKNRMNVENTPQLAAAMTPQNGGGRVWVESVSAGMRTVEAVIRELSQNDVPVLVVAERGSGKAAAAARIHALSSCAAEPFQVYQGREAGEELLAARDGQGGTVYLQEVGDLTAAAQKELVRQIALNGAEDRSVPRYICGTSRELEPEVKAGRFREDLYYGISGVCLRLPPLRQRKEDIPVLRDWFLTAAANDFCRAVPTLSAETQSFFLEYSWPGNIRELKDAARAIVALGDEALAMGGLRSLLRRGDRGGNGEKVSLKEVARAASREAEREVILHVLARTRWNRRRAAQELQISYKALLYKLKQIGYEEYGT
jgi:two-component system, NtrC family, response regulator AtoC